MRSRRRGWVAWVSGLLAAPLLLTGAQAAIADPVAAPGLTVTFEQLQAEIDFRRDVAFDHDPGRVRGLHADSVAGKVPAVAEHGMLFTPAEAAELRARDVAGTQINAVTRRYMAMRQADLFAGAYLDHAAGGLMTVLVTGDRARHEGALRRQVNDPSRLRVVQVAHSERELTAVQERLALAEEKLARAGVRIAYTALDVVRNRVTVGVPAATPAVRAAISRVAPIGILNFDQGVELALTVCTTGLKCSTESPPFNGGTDIESFDTGLGSVQFCTLGFVARSASSSDTFVLSAGHCGRTSTSWVQQSTPIGMVTRNSFSGTSRADAFAIPVLSSLSKGMVKRTATTFHPIKYQERATDDYVGRPTCAYGIRTGYRCGQVLTKTMRAAFGGVTLVSQRVASRPCGPGDSGSPNYFRYRAQGITSFSVKRSDGKMFCGYSHIGHVLSSMGLTTVLSR